MSRLYQNILELVGRTPILPLNRVVPAGSGAVLVKLENHNPSGSVKDRVALALVEDAEARGQITQGGHLVYATSGNSGVALAMVAAVKGYRLTIFMPSNAPLNHRRLLQRYGVDVQLTSPSGGMAGAMRGAETLASSGASSGNGALLLDFFGNPEAVEVHYSHTAAEILQAVGGTVDGFVSGVGTGATLVGVGRRLKESNPLVQVVAVEPANSPILSGGQAGRHMIPGIGPDFLPPLLDSAIIDSVTRVSDSQANEMALRLAREEGLLAGISSGANVLAAIQIAEDLGHGKTVVTLLPDTGERYLDFPI
ncbi:MAG: PLP-dependent cysteine synthase family protein [Chloroflexi bacterium]|nr:PLP-dependent cysteine synthase family protein [Chloroflexota bacterium]